LTTLTMPILTMSVARTSPARRSWHGLFGLLLVLGAPNLVFGEESGGSTPPPPSSKTCSLAILVLSAREIFASRQRIRASWKRGASNVFFLVGNSSCEVPSQLRKDSTCELWEGEETSPFLFQHHKKLEKEVQACLLKETTGHNDLIILPTKDFYRNLPRKLKDAYRWVEFTNATLMKADDDTVFVDMNGELP